MSFLYFLVHFIASSSAINIFLLNYLDRIREFYRKKKGCEEEFKTTLKIFFKKDTYSMSLYYSFLQPFNPVFSLFSSCPREKEFNLHET